jgi:hypothetical protein
MTTNSVGGPHLKGMIQHARASGYTFESAIGDVADGSITQKDSNYCKITSFNNINDNNIVNSIKISDNNELGFHNILDSGVNSPMNWTHESDTHLDSDDVSEYGLGLKSGSVNLGDKMTLYTKYTDKITDKIKYLMVILDWNKMSLKESPECYNPDMIINISVEDYKNQHPFDNGSSIVIESLNRVLVPKDKKSFDFRLEQYIKRVYSYFTNNITIEVNNKVIEPYISPLNKINYPHTIIEYKIWILWNSSNIDYNIVISKKRKNKGYCNFKKLCVSRRATHTSKYLIETIKTLDFNELTANASSITELWFKGTNTYGFDLNEPKKGSVYIRRGNRYITDPTIYTDSSHKEIIIDPRYSFNNKSNNGEYNYHYLELYYTDKRVNKLLGQEFTKRLGQNFPDNLLTHTLSNVEKFIRSASQGLGNASTWKKKWTSEYGIEFDTELDYSKNLELGDNNKKKEEVERNKNYPGVKNIKEIFTKDSDAQVKNTKVNSESVEVMNTEDSDSRVKNTEDSDSRVKNTEDSDSQVKNTEVKNTEVMNTEDSDTEVMNTEDSDTEVMNTDTNFRPGAIIYEAIADYDKQESSHTSIRTHKLPNKVGNYIRCKIGYTEQEIRKREGGGDYNSEKVRIMKTHFVGSVEKALQIEAKLKKFIVDCEFTELQCNRNEYFYCKESHFIDLQTDFANIIYEKN